MTVLLQNRTISMILTVPDVDVLSSSSTPIVEKLDRSDLDQSYSVVKPDHSSDVDSISSMPVYHGSIVRIEQHLDDENTSDLIIRVPNFQRLSHPSNVSDNQQSTRIKRRAPICPILNGPTPHLSTTNMTQTLDNLNQSRNTNTNRLTTGLRSLSRAFTHSCKSKRSPSFSEITTPSALPDVEVITEKVETLNSLNKTNVKHENSSLNIPKLTPPKVLSIKRKHFKIRKKQPSSSISIDTQTDQDYNRNNLTPTSTIITTQYAEINRNNSPRSTTFFHRFIEENNFNQETNVIDNEVDDDDDNEQHNESMRLSFDVEQQFTAISQLISDIPISSIDADSLSTHRYSTISGIIPDIRITRVDNDTEHRSLPEQLSPIILPRSTGFSYEFNPISLPQSIQPNISPNIDRSYRVQTSILQPDISVIRVGTSDLITHRDQCLPGEIISNEQIDSIINIEEKSNNENPIEDDWDGMIRSDNDTFAECYEVIYEIDRQDQNEYEQIDNNLNNLETISKEQEILGNNITRNKSRSVDDLSRTSHDQTSTYQNESNTDSSSELSSRHCTLQRPNASDDYGISVSTDIETRRNHFIRQVDDLSPGEQAGLKENDRILCINGTSVIDEDYTVVLQLLKHGVQTDTLDFDVITNDAYEQFKAQIDELYQ